ncbi:MAG: hypothetical protein R3275_06590 [Saprospiraceae bacterium]|nr:hypothetical protein [Saprospiraceae bacterium]
MKKKQFVLAFLPIFVVFLSLSQLMGQTKKLQYWRAWDKSGLNVFEVPKEDTVEYTGPKVRVGGNYTLQFQALSHENAAGENGAEDDADPQALYELGPGFNLATANLNLDFQLDKGVRIAVENYMSSQHHPEFWVKGGYIQFDNLPFFGNPDWFEEDFRIKVGHFMPNYGDMHYRRTDNANAMFNPLVGNTIMDAFTTEIGGELQYFGVENFVISLGLTNGLINGNIDDLSDSDVNKNPSIIAKLAYDNQMNDDFRLRLSGSVYLNSNSARNTLYAGDRTGSRYYLVLEERDSRAGARGDFTSGRWSPNFTNSVTSIMFNPFIKYKGLEFFGLYEIATGASSPEADDRSVSQLMAEALYRFGANEQLYIAGRYNVLNGELMTSEDMTIDRLQLGVGWFPTKNLLLKLEYVTQNYTDFPEGSQFEDGTFNGIVIEAAVGL